MKTAKYLLTITALILLVSSCKKNDEQTTLYLGYNYFPVDMGRVWTYDADSTITDEFNGTTITHHFQIKEIIDSLYNDLQGRPTLRISQYVRDSSSQPWTIFKVCSINLTNTRAERFEDNIRYVKLAFPTKENVHWNGNSLNTLDPWDYQYTDVHASMTVNNIAYDSVLAVLQHEDDNLITHEYFMEQYATNVGMIYKENTKQELDFNTGTVKSGYIYKQILTGYSP